VNALVLREFSSKWLIGGVLSSCIVSTVFVSTFVCTLNDYYLDLRSYVLMINSNKTCQYIVSMNEETKY